VQKNGDKGFWTLIGCRWAHEAGDGMPLKLNLLPGAGYDIVIRRVKSKITGLIDRNIEF
jgi:hypothetical protein